MVWFEKWVVMEFSHTCGTWNRLTAKIYYVPCVFDNENYSNIYLGSSVS